MLILARKKHEKIIIGSEIQIILIESDCCFARIGIKAPHYIPIHREEIYFKNLRNEINRQNRLKLFREEDNENLLLKGGQ